MNVSEQVYRPGLLMNSLIVNSTEAPKLREIWVLFLTSGIAMMILAVLLLGFSQTGSLSTISRFGLLLAAGAVVQTGSALWARHWRGFVLYLLPGIVYLIVGIILLDQSHQAVASVTLLVAAGLMVTGIFRMTLTLSNRLNHSMWTLIGGIITLMMGISTWWQWPLAGLWGIGVCLGMEMLICGRDWIWLGLTVRKLTPASS